MKIKYIPRFCEENSIIDIIDDNTLAVDGVAYEFDIDSVRWDGIERDTDFIILEAHRDNNELYVSVLRRYNGDCSGWDTGDYQ
jgi:hypothetical protein